MKIKPIKSRIVWMLAYPEGNLAPQCYASTRIAVWKGLSNTDRERESLKRVGWRVIRVKILPLN